MPTPVEKPPHVHPTRMRHIPDADLLAAFGAAGTSVAELRARLTSRPITPVRDTRRWARTVVTGPNGTGPAPRLTAAAEQVFARAEELLTEPFDFTDPAHGRSGLYGFHYLYWTQPLLRAYALGAVNGTPDERFAHRYAEIVDAWYASRDVVRGEWPGLDVIWYSLGVACRSQVLVEALHVLGGSPALPDASWLRILKTLVGGARWLAEEHDTFRHGNWQLASCSVLAQLAAFLPELPESAAWARVALDRLLEHLELDVYADGGHYERCPSYHTMCLGALQAAAIVGERQLGWRLHEHPRFVAMHDWLLAMTAPGGWVPPFNDSHLIHSARFLLRGHHLLGAPEYKGAALRWLTAEQIAEELAWLPPRPGRGDPQAEFDAAPTAEPAAPSQLLPQSKFAVLRAGTGPDALYGVLNCGPLIEHELESHSHRTALDFVLAGFGEPLAWEPGGPDTYDDPHYQSWFRSTHAHNTLALAGREMADDHDADVEVVTTLPQADVVVAAHRGHGPVHRRTLVLVKPAPGLPGYWVVDDELDGAGPYRWLLHGVRPWLPLPDVPHGYRAESGPGLLVLPVRPDRVRAVHQDTGPTSLPTTDGAAPGTLHQLAYEYPPGRATTVLVPFREHPEPVSVQAEADTIRVHAGQVTDLIGRGLLVRTDDEGPRAAVLWRGDRVVFGDRVLLDAEPEGGLCHAGLTWTAGGLRALLRCRRRTTVRFTLPAPGGGAGTTGHPTVRLNDVTITAPVEDGAVRVVLPAEGDWTVCVTPSPDDHAAGPDQRAGRTERSR
ncbi:MAG TPA: heparinase II/III family protein [Pseudonocardiaceae bacterium]